MPSKVRLVVRFDGGVCRAGGQAKDYIRKFAAKYGMKEPVTWKDYVKTVEDFPFRGKAILVLREPRRVDAGRSRYMSICGKYGVRAERAQRPESPRGMIAGPNGLLVPANTARVHIRGIVYERIPNSLDIRWRAV
jgi:hypothetical protein